MPSPSRQAWPAPRASITAEPLGDCRLAMASEFGPSSMASESGGSDMALAKLRNLDETVSIPYKSLVPDIAFLRAIACELCKHKSNEPNPLTTEVEGFTGPTWPFQGTPSDPGGRRCKLCPWVWRVAGYKTDLKQLVRELKNDYEKTAEWLACLRQLVRMVDAGDAYPGSSLAVGQRGGRQCSRPAGPSNLHLSSFRQCQLVSKADLHRARPTWGQVHQLKTLLHGAHRSALWRRPPPLCVFCCSFPGQVWTAGPSSTLLFFSDFGA